MALYVGSIVMHVADVEQARRFWSEALGYIVREDEEEEFEVAEDGAPVTEDEALYEETDFVVLTDPNRRWANISLQLTQDPKPERNRLHLDLYSDDMAAEVERLEELGAVRVEWEYEEGDDFTVMADPDGNEFWVIASEYSQDDISQDDDSEDQ